MAPEVRDGCCVALDVTSVQALVTVVLEGGASRGSLVLLGETLKQILKYISPLFFDGFFHIY